jgi:hypothetical protein
VEREKCATGKEESETGGEMVEVMRVEGKLVITREMRRKKVNQQGTIGQVKSRESQSFH